MNLKSSLCRHFPECGGCESLNLSYPENLKAKGDKLKKIFAGNRDVTISPVLPSRPEHHYRHKIQLPIGRSPKGPVVGLLARDHSKIISLKECHIQHPHLTLVANTVEQWAQNNHYTPYDERKNRGLLRHLLLRRSSRTGEIIAALGLFEHLPGNAGKSYALLKSMVETALKGAAPVPVAKGFAPHSKLVSLVEILRRSKGNIVLDGDRKTMFGKPVIEEAIGPYKFNLNIDSFFQTNPFQIEPLYNLVKAHVEPGSNIIDAFSGMGTIGLYVSDKARSVLCLEQNIRSVKSGKEAILRSRSKNVKIEKADAGKYLLYKLKTDSGNTGVILDPPRDGLSTESITGLLKAKVKYIIYVSCNPLTLKRDADLLQQTYRLASLEPVDMFPFTDHLETVAYFIKK